MDYFEKGNFFPPVEHEARIKKYKENEMLFRGQHSELFKRSNVSLDGSLYISANLASLISKKSADFLIGEGVTISAGKEDNSPEQKAFERFKEDNDLDIQFYESALTNSYKGDAFFKVRYGQEFGGMYPKEVDEYRVRIETLKPQNVFPQTAEHDDDLIVAYHIAIPVRIDYSVPNGSKGAYTLQVESHYTGRIVYREFECTVMNSEPNGVPISYRIGEQIGETEEMFTKVPMPLVVHVPNYSTPDNWEGLDDLSELKPLMAELNNRLSQIASIMDKHSNPAMAVPNNILIEDENGRLMFKVDDSKVFELDKEDVMPQYITWNGQLTEAYNEIDRLQKMIFTIAELPEVALGMGESGTSGSSGLAIKWRMNSLLTKITRKRKYYEKGLKKVMLIAQHLEHIVGIADYVITKPILEFSDGLPQDETEQTNIALQQSGGAVLQSRKTTIMKLYGLTEEQAEAEMERIEEEAKEKRELEAPEEELTENNLEHSGEGYSL